MKYKLINKKTGKETLCDKVTIDGFDYYVGDEIQLGANNVWVATKSRVFKFEIHMAVVKSNMPRIIIATNNPNIDVPKMVDEVEELVKEATNRQLVRIFGLEDDIKKRKFYFKAGYNKSQETHPFSEEDMIEFADWLFTDCSENGPFGFSCKGNAYSNKELLQLWKEQKIKTLYYE